MPMWRRRELLAAAGLAAAGLAVSCTTTPATTRSAETAWTDLTKQLRGSVVRPGDTDFSMLATPRNLRFAATMPEAVVLCAGPDDVAATVSWARKTNTPFAIRGGGHNYADGSSSRGIIISTRRMNSTHIDGTTLRAEAGVRNADLANLLPQGGNGRLLLPGGNCPGVGVAGLTLGGGIGPNAPWAGLAADRLRSAAMVTADGNIVTASATENPDLFWGLRGGAGGNFGVVTGLEYELIEIPVTRATTGLLLFEGDDAILTSGLAFGQVRSAAERIVTGTWSGRPGFAKLRVQVLAGEADARDLLAPLLAIPGVKAEITERPWWDCYRWYVVEPSPAYSFWDRSLYADEYLSADALGAALEVVRRLPANGDPEREGAVGLFGWVGGAVSDIAPDATAYVHRPARMLIEMSSGWRTPPDPTEPFTAMPPDMREWMTELWEVLLPHTTGRSYQNFPDPGLKDWAGAYYGDNLMRLEGVKATWDPEGVFTHSQCIPPPR
jgi:FAD/FMN-containing dehydrogenase